MFANLVKSKNKKNAYDLLTNDAYLNRFFEKSVIIKIILFYIGERGKLQND